MICSTTLPQKAIPHIFQHLEYPAYIDTRRQRYQALSKIAYQRLEDIPGVLVNRTNGAFYMCVVFEDGRLNHGQTLPIANSEVRDLVEKRTSRASTLPFWSKTRTHFSS